VYISHAVEKLYYVIFGYTGQWKMIVNRRPTCKIIIQPHLIQAEDQLVKSLYNPI